MALIGNETVYSRMEGHARQAQFAQLYSRVGMRLSRPKPQNDDISMMLNAWSIEGAPERRLLSDLARKPGAFRGMTKALRLAHVLANGAPVTAEFIRSAWEKISATKMINEPA